MNINKMHNTTSKYPEGYIKNISETYQKNHIALRKIAQNTPTQAPDQDRDETNVADMIEFRLLKSQEKLLELGAGLQISNMDDVTDILEFWYQTVIETVGPDDISPSDELIVTIYNYMSKRVT